MKKQHIASIIILSIGILFTAKNNAQDHKQIVYKTIDTVSLSMDFYYPPDMDVRKTYPAMIFFFGGGWNGGSIEQFEPHARYFSDRGLVCILAEYRVKLRHNTTPFESLMDAKSAIRFIRKNAPEFHIDTSRIIGSVGSTGGHLAAAAALISEFNEPGDDISVSCIPNALVLFNPVIDISPGSVAYDRIGEHYKDFSPLHNIKEGAPPTIIFLRTQDEFIPVETAKYYQKAMEKVGSRCDLHLYEGQPHAFFNYQHRKYYNQTVLKADEFLISLGYLSGIPKIKSD